MKRVLFAFMAVFSSVAFGATLIPVQLLNPSGSTTGQAIVSTGSSSAPAWGSPATLGGVSAASYALLASPTFTGVPSAPNASVGTNTTQIATTAFVAQTFAAPPSLGSTTPGNVFANILSAAGNDALFYRNSSAQSIPNNTFTTITTWTKISDRLNTNFNASTGVFTVPVTGLYKVSGQLCFAATAGAVNVAYQASIVAGGSTQATGYITQQASAGVSAFFCPSVTALLSLTASQTIVLQASQNTGGALALNSTAALTYLSIYRLP
jgi:hypothetical protein